MVSGRRLLRCVTVHSTSRKPGVCAKTTLQQRRLRHVPASMHLARAAGREYAAFVSAVGLETTFVLWVKKKSIFAQSFSSSKPWTSRSSTYRYLAAPWRRRTLQTQNYFTGYSPFQCVTAARIHSGSHRQRSQARPKDPLEKCQRGLEPAGEKESWSQSGQRGFAAPTRRV